MTFAVISDQNVSGSSWMSQLSIANGEQPIIFPEGGGFVCGSSIDGA